MKENLIETLIVRKLFEIMGAHGKPQIMPSPAGSGETIGYDNPTLHQEKILELLEFLIPLVDLQIFTNKKGSVGIQVIGKSSCPIWFTEEAASLKECLCKVIITLSSELKSEEFICK